MQEVPFSKSLLIPSPKRHLAPKLLNPVLDPSFADIEKNSVSSYDISNCFIKSSILNPNSQIAFG